MPRTISKKKIKKGFFAALSISIAVLMIISILTIDARTWDALLRVNKVMLGLSFLLMFAAWLSQGIAFFLLSRAIGKRPGVFAMVKVYLIGNFAGYVTPFGMAAPPTQIYFLTRTGFSAGEAAAVSGARALLSGWFFGLMGPIILIFFSRELPAAAWTKAFTGILGLIFVVTLVFLYFLWKPDKLKKLSSGLSSISLLQKHIAAEKLEHITARLTEEIEKMHGNFLLIFGKKPFVAIGAFICNIFSWVAVLAIVPILLIGLGWQGNFYDLIFREFILHCLVPLSPTPGGSGAAELGLTALLYTLVPKHILGVSVIIWRFITYYLTLIVGGFLFFTAGGKEHRSRGVISGTKN